MIPKDPVMLMSYLNTQLRDFYPSLLEKAAAGLLTLEELCAALDQDRKALEERLAAAGFHYSPARNQFL